MNDERNPGDRPATMRAVQAVALGAPDVLRAATMPLPDIGPGEVLIRTSFASVNFADVKARRGGHHIQAEVPYLPGLDVAGVVAAVGEGVEHLSPGDRVAAATDGGAYAEWVKARGVLAYRIPDGVAELGQAAGVVALMTAYNVLVVKAGLAPGETVLVHAAAGGVGTLLLQLAGIEGAGRVIGVVGSEEKVAVAHEFGADEVIVSRGEGYAARLAEVAPDGVDVVLDSAGGPFFEAGFARLAPFGRLVNFGNAAGDPPVLDPASMHKKNLAVFGYSSGTYRRSRPDGVRLAASTMLDHLGAGRLRVPVGGVYPLEEAADAHRAIESRQSTGKLLLEP